MSEEEIRQYHFIHHYIDHKGLTSDGFIKLTESLENLIEKFIGKQIIITDHDVLCEIRIDLMEFIDDQIGKTNGEN